MFINNRNRQNKTKQNKNKTQQTHITKQWQWQRLKNIFLHDGAQLFTLCLHTSQVISNCLHTLQFALNFVLYTVVNQQFRQTFKELLFCSRKNNVGNARKEQMLSLSSVTYVNRTTRSRINSLRKKTLSNMSYLWKTSSNYTFLIPWSVKM